MVKCPRCAEGVRLHARVCRSCGHKFPGGARPDHDPAHAIGIGCGLLMIIGFVGLLHSCITSDDVDGSAEATMTSLERAEKNVADLDEQLERATITCRDGPPRHDLDGEIALAEVDLAMVEGIDSVSPEQERRIRASLGAEMGLAPSEVDGWRDIYRSRAEAARRVIQGAEARERDVQRSACVNVPDLKSQLERAKSELRRETTSR